MQMCVFESTHVDKISRETRQKDGYMGDRHKKVRTRRAVMKTRRWIGQEVKLHAGGATAFEVVYLVTGHKKQEVSEMGFASVSRWTCGQSCCRTLEML